MALENSKTTFDALAQDSRIERAPDSSPLRVSLNTQFESGIPPARLREGVSLEAGAEHLERALSDVTRTEANLGLLLRGLKHLAVAATAAREANTDLSRELDELRTHLARGNEEEHALRYRMGQLEQLLDVIRHESARERAFLIEQSDLFLVQILSDHERQVGDLRRMLKEAMARGGEVRQREIEELTTQRDQAREYATRCERERDAAWLELANSEVTPVPPTLARRPAPAEVPVPRQQTPSPRLSPVRAAMEQNEFAEVTEEELRGASPPVTSGPRAASQPSVPSSPGASATAIGALSLRAVQVPASHVSTSKQPAVEADDNDGDRLTTSYSLSGTEIAD